MKNTFSVFEAKARLSEIIRIVLNQHEVIITDRSKPVVVVVPFQAKKKNAGLTERLDELPRQGQISPPQDMRTTLQQRSLPKSALKQFLKDRE